MLCVPLQCTLLMSENWQPSARPHCGWQVGQVHLMARSPGAKSPRTVTPWLLCRGLHPLQFVKTLFFLGSTSVVRPQRFLEKIDIFFNILHKIDRFYR